MGRKVIYALGTAGIFYLAVLYRSRSLLMLCWAAVLLPLFFLCLLFRVKRGLEVELLVSPYPQEGTGDYLVGIRVRNPGNLYLSRIRGKIKLQNSATGKCQWVKVSGKVPAKSQVELMGKMKNPGTGLWKAECRSIRCYEWTNLLYLARSLQERRQTLIFPDVFETNVKIGLRTRLFWSDGEQYHPQASGDDPSETLKLREYQKGDRMNRVHWKLSVKNDSLIVAEMSMPIGCNVVIFLDGELDFRKEAKTRCYWEVVNTVSQELLGQECPHYLVWKGQGQDRLSRKAVRDAADLAEFWSMIFAGSIAGGVSREAYGREFSGEAYASWIVWNGGLELSCNGRLLAKIQPDQAKQQLAELELIL